MAKVKLAYGAVAAELEQINRVQRFAAALHKSCHAARLKLWERMDGQRMAPDHRVGRDRLVTARRQADRKNNR